MTTITIIPLPAFTIIRGSACFILNFTNCLGTKICLKLRIRLCYFFTNQGGEHFYAIEVPIVKLVECLRESGMTDMADNMIAWFKNMPIISPKQHLIIPHTK